MLSVKEEGNPAVEIETLRNMYFPILPCKYPATALLLNDKGDAVQTCAYLLKWILYTYTVISISLFIPCFDIRDT